MPDLIRKDFTLETIDEVRKKSQSFKSIDEALLYAGGCQKNSCFWEMVDTCR